MNRSASEIIRNLQMRVARLERQSSWDEPRNYNHPMMQVVRGLEGTKLGSWTLEESPTGASVWTNGIDEVYVTYEGPQTTFAFTKEDEFGTPTVVGRIDVGRGGIGSNDSAADFLKASKRVLSRLN